MSNELGKSGDYTPPEIASFTLDKDQILDIKDRIRDNIFVKRVEMEGQTVDQQRMTQRELDNLTDTWMFLDFTGPEKIISTLKAMHDQYNWATAHGRTPLDIARELRDTFPEFSDYQPILKTQSWGKSILKALLKESAIYRV